MSAEREIHETPQSPMLPLADRVAAARHEADAILVVARDLGGTDFCDFCALPARR